MEITIQTATVAHLNSILGIMNQAILYTTAIYDYEPKNIKEVELWFKTKQDGNFPVIVALQNDEVVGYATYHQLKDKAGYKFCVEHSVYVAEEQKGKGIGKLLLSELIDIAKEQSMHSMIGLIDAENKNSIAFHEKFGFTKAGLLKQAGYKFNRWLDVQIMQLILD
ncbi:N-acetyltransferase [Flavobacterium suaedae]|uniref:N-acetyltransferase n=1 Tax=Flavobacterium suaedae TaxID=1767027 RepID=A0ABQ1JXG9_9FLAO|nr:GNAT family N-acetyltransferase [Flavobacterium suaedae]GGB81380.1 N-acetyltransferase [Flavobacterium suaedae]